MGRQDSDMRVRVVPADHPGRLPNSGRHFLGLLGRVGEQRGVDLDAVLLPLAPHLRQRAPYHRGGAAPAGGLDVAEEEAHDLLGLGGEGVGEACEPHLLAEPDLRQRHLRRPAAAVRLGFRVGAGAEGSVPEECVVLCCACS